jgi:non-ribosomal peptide synthetase component F
MFGMNTIANESEMRLGEVTLIDEPSMIDQAKFDLQITFLEGGHELGCHLSYCKDLFREETVDRMLGHYRELLGSIVAGPDQRIGALPMLSREERSSLLEEYRASEAEYPG